MEEMLMSAAELTRDLYYRNDPRTEGWFLVSRPATLVMILLFYIYVCVYLGPRYMKNKQPYSLRKTLIVYNFLQVLLSLYLTIEGGMLWGFEYSWTCQPVDYSDNPSALKITRGAYLYFISKLIELLDTMFFILRKKDRQISFLHVYHHSLMPVLGWYGVRYIPGGHPTLLGTVNCFIHIVMYTYYMLAAFGPKVQKYLWWKNYLTLLQILQFVIVGTHSGQMLFTNCNFPKQISTFILFQSLTFIYLFGSFYIQTFRRKNVRTTELGDGSTESRKILKSQ